MTAEQVPSLRIALRALDSALDSGPDEIVGELAVRLLPVGPTTDIEGWISEVKGWFEAGINAVHLLVLSGKDAMQNAAKIARVADGESIVSCEQLVSEESKKAGLECCITLYRLKI